MKNLVRALGLATAVVGGATTAQAATVVFGDLLSGTGAPASLDFASLQYDIVGSDVNFTLRGVIRGTPDLAAGYASNYLQQLKTDPVFLPMFAEITLSSLSQNPQSGRLQFEIKFRLKEVKKS